MQRILHSNLNNAKVIIIANTNLCLRNDKLGWIVDTDIFLSIKVNVLLGKGNKMKEHKRLTVEDVQCQYV